MNDKEFLDYCQKHFTIKSDGHGSRIIMMDNCYIGMVSEKPLNEHYYAIGTNAYTQSFLPKFLFREKVSKVECYSNFDKHSTEPSNVACIGFSEENKSWLGWSHRAWYSFTIGYVVEKGSFCTKTGWLEEYEKQHPERCFNLPVGFTCKTLDDCRKCAIAYAMSIA